jgi:hypothetical protein
VDRAARERVVGLGGDVERARLRLAVRADPPPSSSVTSSSERSKFGSAWCEIDTAGSVMRWSDFGRVGSVTSITSVPVIEAE